MYVYCVESFAHIECYSDCLCRGSHLVETPSIWLKPLPFATVLFTVCNAITGECCVLYPYCVGVFGMFCGYVRKKALLQCLCNY